MFKINIHSLYWFFGVLYLLEAALSIYFQCSITRFEDIVVHLNGAERIVHGEVLYRDIIVPTFPMFFYLRVPGIFIAEHLNLNIYRVAVAFDNIMALLSIMLTVSLFKKTSFGLPGSLCFMTGGLISILFLFPYYDNTMGQQEYFFFLCTLPYFTLAAARVEGIAFARSFRIFIGVFAAIGFCYKPPFIIPLLLVEIYVCRYAQTWRELLRAECLACIAVGIAYLLWVLLCLPGFMTTMLSIEHFYYEWHNGWWKITTYFFRQLFCFIAPVTALFGYATWKNIPQRRFLHIYFLSCLGYMLSAILQLKTKGFEYHLFPTYAMMLLTVSVSVLALLQVYTALPVRRHKIALILAGLVLAGLTLYSGYITANGIYKYKRQQQNDRIILDHIAEIKRLNPTSGDGGVYLFGRLLHPIFSEGIIDRGISWDYHFYDQWLLKGITIHKHNHRELTKNQLDADTQEAEQFLQQTETEDLQRLKPAIIMVRGNPDRVYISYFSRYAPFVELMKNYAFKENFRGLDIYVRQP